jgi:predicted membrane-bound spermidine synthase
VAAQFSLARVTLASLSGNEFGAGLFLAFWLLFGGAGCLLFPVVARRQRRPASAFVILMLLLGVLVPASCYGIVLARRLLFGLTFSLSLSQTLALAALAALPVSLTVGALFGAALRAGPDAQGTAGVLYLADAVGSFLGGLLASFLLAPFVPTVVIAFAAGSVALFTGAVTAVRLRAAAGLVAACALVGIAAIVVLVLPGSRHTAVTALARTRHPAGEIEASVDSRYQGFVAVRSRESLSFYQDGVLTFFSQAGEREEEIAHLALLSRPAPGSVLLVGNGWPFLPREILKHPVASLEMIVLDREVHRAGAATLPSELASTLSDPRLHIRYGDPQELLSRSGQRFDAIFVDTGVPDTLLAARLYTREFLQRLAGLLEDDGIVVLALPSVQSYLSPALLSLNASLRATLRAVFGGAMVIPGEYAGNVFIAGRTIDPAVFAAGPLADVLESRGIAARWINRHSLSTILEPQRLATLERQLSRTSGALHTLEYPVLLLFSLEYREEMAGSSGVRVMLGGFRLWHAAAALLALGLALVAAQRLSRRARPLPGCAAAAGFSGMVTELSLLCTFQLVSGNLYAGMAALVGFFMAGMAGGSAAAPALAARVKRIAAVRLLAAVLLLGLGGAGATAALAPSAMTTSRGLFLGFIGLAMALAGFCSGASVSLMLGRREAMAAASGAIYGADLLGGAVGGACASVLLFPVLGVSRSLWLAVMGYGFALLLLAGTGGIGKGVSLRVGQGSDPGVA